MADDAKDHCKICFASTAKYVCPQCGIPYCSTKCYRDVDKHLKCSESFYRRCVQEELKSQSVEDSSKERTKIMKEILQRHRTMEDPPNMNENLGNSDSEQEEEDDEEEELDSDDDEPLERRLNDIDLDDSEKVWDKLTAEEKEDFLKMVRANESQGVEPVAEPWFPGLTSTKLIQEVQNNDVEPS